MSKTMDKTIDKLATTGSSRIWDKEEMAKNGSSSPSSGRSSPDTNCPICLGKPENKSFTDSCLHQFCFTCLVKWSKVKAECPLCKQRFKSIIHNVRSVEDFDEYFLSTDPQGQSSSSSEDNIGSLFAPQTLTFFNMPNRQRDPFRYRTTSVPTYLDYFIRLEEAMTNSSLPVERDTPRWYNNYRPSSTNNAQRRNVYQLGLWVQRSSHITSRVRNCTPQFYRDNPALLHRLAPWLDREVHVLCNGEPEDVIQSIINRILDLIRRFHIRSNAFRNSVHVYFHQYTEHFVHEFYNFACSPYDLIAYDRYSTYVENSALETEEVEYIDSDLEILSMTPSADVISIRLDDSDSDDCVVVGSVRQPEVITLDSDPEVVQVNIQIDHNRPGSTQTVWNAGSSNSWVKVQNVSSINENVNVSINIDCSSRQRNHSSDRNSDSSWTPSTKKIGSSKRKSKQRKKNLPRKMQSAEANISNVCSKRARVNDVKLANSVLPLKKRKSATVILSDDHSSDNDIKIEDDYDSYSSTSSEAPFRLRSVVVKSTTKSSQPKPQLEWNSDSDEAAEPPPISGRYWNGFCYKYLKINDDKKLRQKRVDPSGASTSKDGSFSSSSMSSEKKYVKKSRYYGRKK